MRVCTPQETQDPNTGQSLLEDYQICFRSIGQTGAAAYRVRRKCSRLEGLSDMYVGHISNCLYLGGQWRTSFNEEQRPTHFSW